MISLLGLDPQAYTPHGLHAPSRTFPETNCYTDLWIETLHALGHEPTAMLGCCAIVDWEGDQWTFFKPSFADLERLYGTETYELAVYRSLDAHIVEQLRLGRFVIVEVDGHFLPDTAGRSYNATHEKTSITVEAIDSEARRLRYFHNGGYWELESDDYVGALRLGPRPPDDLPPYVEVVRRGRLRPCPRDQLRAEASLLLAGHLARRPHDNPVRRFGEHLASQLPSLHGEEAFHVYAFATLRQCGAAWDAAAAHLRWLGDQHGPAASGFEALAGDAKRLLLRLARTAATGRAFDPEESLAAMAATWDETLDRLTA